MRSSSVGMAGGEERYARAAYSSPGEVRRRWKATKQAMSPVTTGADPVNQATFRRWIVTPGIYRASGVGTFNSARQVQSPVERTGVDSQPVISSPGNLGVYAKSKRCSECSSQDEATRSALVGRCACRRAIAEAVAIRSRSLRGDGGESGRWLRSVQSAAPAIYSRRRRRRNVAPRSAARCRVHACRIPSSERRFARSPGSPAADMPGFQHAMTGVVPQ